MPLYRDAAIVLRTHKLRESDRIITMLTRDHGKIRAVQHGARKTRSRAGARLEPGMLADVQCYTGKTNLDTVKETAIHAAYGDHIARDYGAYTAASAVLETADRLTEEHETSRPQFALLAGALAALARGEHPAGLVLDSYLLRALAIGGWAASFTDCAGCGQPGPHRAFNLASGGAVCVQCRAPGSAAPRTETFALLAALQTGDWLTADASDEPERREARGLVAAYVQWHLERGVRSLRLVDTG